MIAISKMNEISSKNEMNTVHDNKNNYASSNRSMCSRNTADGVE